MCEDCTNREHVCFLCGDSGPVGGALLKGEGEEDGNKKRTRRACDPSARVFKCSVARCGKFYHHSCIDRCGDALSSLFVRRSGGPPAPVNPREALLLGKAKQEQAEAAAAAAAAASPSSSLSASPRRKRLDPALRGSGLSPAGGHGGSAFEDEAADTASITTFVCGHHRCATCNNEKGRSGALHKCLTCPRSFHLGCIPPGTEFHEYALVCNVCIKDGHALPPLFIEALHGGNGKVAKTTMEGGRLEWSTALHRLATGRVASLAPPEAKRANDSRHFRLLDKVG